MIMEQYQYLIDEAYIEFAQTLMETLHDAENDDEVGCEELAVIKIKSNILIDDLFNITNK